MYIIIATIAIIGVHSCYVWIGETPPIRPRRAAYVEPASRIARTIALIATIVSDELAFRSAFPHILAEYGMNRMFACAASSIAGGYVQYLIAYVRDPFHEAYYVRHAIFNVMLGMFLFDVRSVLARIVCHVVYDLAIAAITARIKQHARDH